MLLLLATASKKDVLPLDGVREEVDEDGGEAEEDGDGGGGALNRWGGGVKGWKPTLG